MKLEIDDLKDTSKLWCDKGIKKFPENEIYYISTDIILDNLCYNGMDIPINDKSHYKLIYEDLKNNGWDSKYPARIDIGDMGEVFVNGGNHRINLIKKLNINFVPFKLVYQRKIGSNKNLIFIKSGQNFYPTGLLPKWSIE